MLNTLAVIPAIGTEKDWREKGLAKVFKGVVPPKGFYRNDTLLSIATSKAKEVTPNVLVISDNSAVLREAERTDTPALRVKRGKYHSFMSNGDLYLEAIYWWAKKRKDVLLDILLVVNWETPTISAEDLREIAKLEEHDASSACIVFEESGKFWRAQSGFSKHIPEWNWGESIFVDSKAAYSTWIGDYVMMRHFRVPRHYMHVVPKSKATRIVEQDDLHLVKGFFRCKTK